MEWEKLVKRYVWDDDKTPYFVPIARLTRRQADNEILVYCLFLGVLFAVVTVASLSAAGPHGRSLGMAFYSFSVVCAAIVFGMTKSFAAVVYLSVTPLAGLLYLFVFGFSSQRELVDTLVVTGLLALLLGYSVRILALARAYARLPQSKDDAERPRFRRPFGR